MVSVSKMISRMAPLNTRREAETSEDIASTWARVSSRLPRCVDDEVGPRALFLVGHLAGEDLLEFLRRSCPGRASTRSRCISGGAETTITLSNAASPPVSNSKGMSNSSAGASPCSTMKRVALMMHRRDGRSPPARPARRGSPSTAADKRFAIDRAVAGRAGKARFDRGDQPRRRAPAIRRTAASASNSRDAGLGEHRGDGRLAHADRPGERERDHRPSFCQSSPSRSRGGSWPKNSLKLVAACSTSMSRPSHRQAALSRRRDQAASRPDRRPCRTPSRRPASRRGRSCRQSPAGHAERRRVDQPVAVDRRGERRGLDVEPELDRQLASLPPCRAPGSDTAEIPTSCSATSAARAAPPLPSRVTLPIARLGLVQPGEQGRDRADIGVGGDQLAVAHHQHIGRAGGDRPVGGVVGQRDRVELQRHGDIAIRASRGRRAFRRDMPEGRRG